VIKVLRELKAHHQRDQKVLKVHHQRVQKDLKVHHLKDPKDLRVTRQLVHKVTKVVRVQEVVLEVLETQHRVE